MFESLCKRPLTFRERLAEKISGLKYVGSMPISQWKEMEDLYLQRHAALARSEEHALGKGEALGSNPKCGSM